MTKRMTSRLKELIDASELLVMPGAFDAMSAILIERAGFKAVQISGLGVSLSALGRPDIGVMGLRDLADRVFQISHAVAIPVMADGDTGFGNAVNTYHTVREVERAGAAGINLEDQTFPKRCGHTDGKDVISEAEMVEKLRAARDGAEDPDFVINGRTDALAVLGYDAAVSRGRAYAEAGADLIFIEGVQSEQQIRDLVKDIGAPVSINLAEGGKSPLPTFTQLQDWGIARASCPGTTLFAAIQGIEEALSALTANDGPAGHAAQISDLQHYKEIVGWQAMDELDRRYAVSAPDKNGQ